jgi:hypothetical protein
VIVVYGKIFDQIYEGTLASRGPWQALVTFQQLIVLANRHGEVDMTADAISRRTTIPLDIIQLGLEALQKNDPESRTPSENGKRITPIEPNRAWGWRIVNYEKYRRIRSEEERREYMRSFMADKRARKRAGVLAPVSSVSPCSKQYAVSSKQKEKPTPCASAHVVPVEVWLAFVERRKKLRGPLTQRAGELIRRKLERLKEQGYDPVEVLEQSIANGWKGVFEVRKENENGRGKQDGGSKAAIHAQPGKYEHRANKITAPV